MIRRCQTPRAKRTSIHPAAALLALLAAGCASESSSPRAASRPAAPAATATAPAQAIASSGGSYTVRFSPPAADLPVNELFTLQVTILDGSGAVPATDVTLAVDAAMPAHRHGMNTAPQVRQSGPGRFTVEGMLLHMPGDWELYFDITRGAVTERAQVAVALE
jgi:hypothetical protein